jgi:hypothetical protein
MQHSAAPHWPAHCVTVVRKSSTRTRERNSPSDAFTSRPEAENILISIMGGRGRALDNVFVERLWRTVKYEDVYLKDYSDPPDAVRNLGPYSSSTMDSGCIKRWIIKRRKPCTAINRKQRCRFAATSLDEF